MLLHAGDKACQLRADLGAEAAGSPGSAETAGSPGSAETAATFLECLGELRVAGGTAAGGHQIALGIVEESGDNTARAVTGRRTHS